jgi:hypothetical protein
MKVEFDKLELSMIMASLGKAGIILNKIRVLKTQTNRSRRERRLDLLLLH